MFKFLSPIQLLCSYLVVTTALIYSILPVQHVVMATPLLYDPKIAPNVHAILPVLYTVTIPPGATWSFNETVGNPEQYALVDAYGVYGGGWCDVASRYAELARVLTLDREFFLHSTPLNGVERIDNVSIWNTDGSAGQLQDLTIKNTKKFAITFTMSYTGEAYILTASYSYPRLLQGPVFTTP
jgi:hypothetical protein